MYLLFCCVQQPVILFFCFFVFSFFTIIKKMLWGAWVAHSIKHLTSAHVMISPFPSSSPIAGSVLTAQGLESVLDSVSPSLSLPSPPCALSLSLSKINKRKKKIKKQRCCDHHLCKQTFLFSL